MSYKDAATSPLKVAIIDKDNPYGKITTKREILVKKIPMGELDKTILSASCSKTKPPIFRSWSRSGEITRVTCDDDLTLEWPKTKVPALKTWEGATLAVVRMDELPKLTKASLWIPGEAQADLDEKEVVLRRLKGQKQTYMWRNGASSTMKSKNTLKAISSSSASETKTWEP
ncbi:unnamed protein product [Psylliodes chrysocephalus]|uniref:DUF4780 domain-containing protein n=1 Tax=Psylliodes chrysocephalus TaxID=3402493 RepID=A0A9P0CGF9_9CUCU|nr:unnamed protein product [Psylliodes chrysocephala]